MPVPLTTFLAPARISGYRSFLKLRTDEEVCNAYCWNYAVSAALFPLLGCIEMHLRDAVHATMAERYAPPGTANLHGYAWYDQTLPSHFPLQNRALQAVEDLLYVSRSRRLKSPPPTTDDVVASLTFGFWANLFRTLAPVEAPRIIPAVFPYHPIRNPKRWGNSAVRRPLDDQLRVANDFRNRVAHHEPLFKFRYNGAYPTNLARGLSNLRACMNDCFVISNWINPAASETLERSIWYRQFDQLSVLDNFRSWVRFGAPEGMVQLQWRCAGVATDAGLVAAA